MNSAQTMTLQDVFESVSDIFRSENKKEVRILSDCNYSNKWVTNINKCRDNDILNESKSVLHIYGSSNPKSGQAKDGIFPRWICNEIKDGICYHGIIDKDGGWTKLIINSKVIELRSLSEVEIDDIIESSSVFSYHPVTNIYNQGKAQDENKSTPVDILKKFAIGFGALMSMYLYYNPPSFLNE